MFLKNVHILPLSLYESSDANFIFIIWYQVSYGLCALPGILQIFLLFSIAWYFLCTIFMTCYSVKSVINYRFKYFYKLLRAMWQPMRVKIFFFIGYLIVLAIIISVISLNKTYPVLCSFEVLPSLSRKTLLKCTFFGIYAVFYVKLISLRYCSKNTEIWQDW